MKTKIKFAVLVPVSMLIACLVFYELQWQHQMNWMWSSSAGLNVSLRLDYHDQLSSEVEYNRIGRRRRKRILIYTALFGSIPWGYIPYNYNFTDYDGKFCPVYDCDVTYDKGQLSSSDLVVFYGRDLPSTEHLKSISKTDRPSNQSWLFFMHESPVFSYFDGQGLQGMFNLTATYRSDSDILVTYHFHDPLREGDERPKFNHNFAKGMKVIYEIKLSFCPLLQIA